MITIDDLKLEFRIDTLDTSQDDYLKKLLKRQQKFIIGYCNNYTINFDDTSDLENNPIIDELDDVLLFLCVRSYNPDARFRAGKDGENLGGSVTFSKDIPSDFKKVLKRYKRLHFY